MDFTEFIRLKDTLEPSLKAGLYAVMQSHLPPEYSYFRAGLAGKPVDSATQFKSSEGTFASRFATYLNYWGPSNAKVYACLTVPRKSIMGFAERVMPPADDRDGREEYARLHLGSTLIQIREKEYHQKLVELGAVRWRMPTTQEGRERSEFFRCDVQTCIRALKSIGTGDLFTFTSNDPTQMTKTSLRKRGIEQIEPSHVALRKSSRLQSLSSGDKDDDDDDDFDEFNAMAGADEDDVPLTLRVSAGPTIINQLSTNNPQVVQVINQLGSVRRRSPRIAEVAAQPPLEVQMTPAQLRRLRKGDPNIVSGLRALGQVRRSPRLAAANGTAA